MWIEVQRKNKKISSPVSSPVQSEDGSETWISMVSSSAFLSKLWQMLNDPKAPGLHFLVSAFSGHRPDFWISGLAVFKTRKRIKNLSVGPQPLGLKWPVCCRLSSGFVRKENLAKIFQTSKNKFIHSTTQYLWFQKGTVFYHGSPDSFGRAACLWTE